MSAVSFRIVRPDIRLPTHPTDDLDSSFQLSAHQVAFDEAKLELVSSEKGLPFGALSIPFVLRLLDHHT